MDTQNEWSANQWEAYLTELEVEQTETLLNQAGIVEAMPEDYYQEGFSELIGTNYSEKLSNMWSSPKKVDNLGSSFLLFKFVI